ncbi:MAG TPA: WD40 repeat domain-containing serine/threonine protein kinase [Gemmataceae bacterium]|nr:WD40 repeat domain-containing serine/threonine protein kinase [Gemmataceae bacterium]
MTDNDVRRDQRLAEILEKIEADLRSGVPFDLASWQARCPDVAADLPSLVQTLRQFQSAVDDCRAGTGETVVRAAAGDTGEWRPNPESPTPRRVGRYEVTGRLGAGGMGTVYRARDPQLGRDVAIKVPRFEGPPAARAAAQARFEREARAAAAVRQAHVCPIYDVGTWDGVPYVVMAFVEGQSLADLVAAGPVEPRRAAELVRQVTEGLHAVHDHGVIHRDLKPANILLDAAGQALLTDFGLARYDSGGERLTADGSVLGTPAYLAPEQAARGGDDVGPVTDVYSLGAVLYELVTGQPPYRGNPVTVIYQVAQQAPPLPSQHRPGLDPALEAILLKAMARRPQQRYPSARAFADALQGWLAGPAPAAPPPAVPVAAHAPTVVWPTAVAEPAPTPARRRRMARPGDELTWHLWNIDTGKEMEPLLSGGEERVIAAAPDGKLIATVAVGKGPSLWDPTTGKHLASLPLTRPPDQGPAVGPPVGAGFSADGKLLAVVYSGQNQNPLDDTGSKLFKVYDVAARKEIDGERVPQVAMFAGPVFTPDAGGIVVGIREMNQKDSVRVWDLASRGWRGLKLAVSKGTFALSPDGKRLAIAGGLHDAATGEKLVSFDGPPIHEALAFSPDGQRVVGAGYGGEVAVYEAATGKLVTPVPEPFHFLAVSADGTVMAVPQGNVLRLVDTVTRKERARVRLPAGQEFWSAAFSPDGNRLVASNFTTNGLGVYDTANGEYLEQLTSLPPPGRPRLAFSADGKRFVAGYGGAVLWDTATWKEPTTIKALKRCTLGLALSPDGKLVAGAWEDGLTVAESNGGKERFTRDGSGPIAFSPDGTRFACGRKVRDTATGKELVELKDASFTKGFGLAGLVFSPDSKTVFGCGTYGHLVCWSASDGGVLKEWRLGGLINRIALTSDGRYLFTSNANGTVYVLRLDLSPERAKP